MTHQRGSRHGASLGALVTSVFEILGILNKGSAAQTKGNESKADDHPIDAPALNVTRVGGFAAFIGAVGTATLALYQMPDNPTDGLRIAAWACTALVVSAALITAAIIISADIRARSNTSTSASGKPPSRTEAAATTEADFRRAWESVRTQLQGINDQLPAATDAQYTRLWLRAEKGRAISARVEPLVDQADEHQLLLAAQEEVSRLLNRLREHPRQTSLVDDIRTILDEVNREVDGLPAGQK